MKDKKIEDRLEQFISDHRNQFDDESPSLQVWAGIQDQIVTKPVRSSRHRNFWYAAAAVGLLLLGVALGSVLTRSSLPTGLDMTQAQDLKELEDYYYAEVEDMVNQLVSSPDYEGVQRELNLIDKDIEALKKELLEVPVSSKQAVLQSIIASYETKVQVLENVREHAKSFKERNEEGPTNM